MNVARIVTTEMDCPDCGHVVEVEAEIWDGNAYWSCPTTECDRTFMDPQKITEWVEPE